VLGRAGHRIAVGSTSATASGLGTRHAVARFVMPDPDRDMDAYADAVVDAAHQCEARCVLASTDASLVALHRRRDQLAPAVPGIPPFEATAIALDKMRTFAAAAGCGVPVPRGSVIPSLADLPAAVAEVGLPAIVKPSAGWQPDVRGGGFHAAPVLLRNHEDAVAAAELGWSGPVIVQEYATGQREAHMLLRTNGAVIGRAAFRALRTWPPLGGSSVLRESIVPPADSLAYAESLIAAVGIEGYCEVEFRRSSDGRPLLMEINARFSQALEVAHRAGVDLISMQRAVALGEPVTVAPPAEPGVRVAWLAGDLRLAASAFGVGPAPHPRVAESLRALGSDFSGRARLDGFDRCDLRPTVGAIAFTLREALRWPARTK
jgi:predicted ATP-grasp superfamily ATP-dependent carboligase